MQVLKEISQVSSYRPLRGQKKDLYELTVVKGYGREKAETLFEKQHKKGHFSIVFKKLKYRLLDGLLNISAKIPATQIARMKIWTRHLQIKILLAVEKIDSGVKLATQAINNAEKEEEFLVMLSYSKMLLIQFSGNNFDAAKYAKYKEKYNKALRYINESHKATEYYLDLIYHHKTKRALNHVPAQIEELDQISATNSTHKFRMHYYAFKSLYFRAVGEQINFLSNNQAAVRFFDSLTKTLPYQIKFNFLTELVPIYILQGQYKEASSAIFQCELIVPLHSMNWHKILIYKSLLGFWSGNPHTALAAYEVATQAPRQFDSSIIDEKWHLIKGYLALYHKLGLIPSTPSHFRIKSWVNVIDKRHDDAAKANRLIIESLYYLFNKKHDAFFEVTEKIGYSMNKRFKAHRFARTRVFFRALKCITKGNYHPVLTTAYAKKYIKQLQVTNSTTDAQRLEVEMVGYLDLWSLILQNL